MATVVETVYKLLGSVSQQVVANYVQNQTQLELPKLQTVMGNAKM
jgi:hypothetical protein